MRVWICPLPEARELMQSITRVCKCLETSSPCSGQPGHPDIGSKEIFMLLALNPNCFQI